MFEIKQNDRFDETQRLLYNIWQELKTMNEKKEEKKPIEVPIAKYLDEEPKVENRQNKTKKKG